MTEPRVPTPGPIPKRRRALRIALVGMLVFGSAALAFLLGVHPFFAVTHPVTTRTLVVEGWLPDHAMQEAVQEFHRGSYTRLFTTGGPLERGSFLSHYQSFAESSAQTLLHLGLSSNVVTAVPSSVRHRNRTYGAAVALRDYCQQHHISLDSFNLVTEGAHARRSWLCFRRAFQSHAQVGVISLEDRDYDSHQWWRFSEGVKTIISETIGFTYAWLSLDYGK